MSSAYISAHRAWCQVVGTCPLEGGWLLSALSYIFRTGSSESLHSLPKVSQPVGMPESQTGLLIVSCPLLPDSLAGHCDSADYWWGLSSVRKIWSSLSALQGCPVKWQLDVISEELDLGSSCDVPLVLTTNITRKWKWSRATAVSRVILMKIRSLTKKSQGSQEWKVSRRNTAWYETISGSPFLPLTADGDRHASQSSQHPWV